MPKLTVKEKRAWAEATAQAASDYGVSLDLVIEVLRQSGFDWVKACGCAQSETWQLTIRCTTHRQAQKRMDSPTPRACPCGEVDKLTAQSAAAHRVGNLERVDELRRRRADHVCLRAYCRGCSKWKIAKQVQRGYCKGCQA